MLSRKIRIPRPDRADLPALLGFFALAVFVCREPIFLGRAFYLRDLHLQWYGQVESFVRAVASGSWPLWDPHVSFGQPLLANANNEVLYPPTWLNLLMRPWTYYTLFLGGHLFFSATGLYVLGRKLGLSRAAAFVAGGVWVASGPFLSLGNLWNHLAAAAWMPWVVLAARATLASGRRTHALLWGVALAAQIVAGSPDVVAMTGLLVAGLVLAHLARPAPGSPSAGRALALAALALGFGLCLAAGQLLPSFDVALRSGRFGMGAESRTYWSVHPLALLWSVAPVSWSDVALSTSLRERLLDSREPLLLSLYLGLPALTLAGAGVAGASRPMRRVAIAVGAAAVLLALGPHTPVYPIAVRLLPPLAVLRYPSKAMVLVAFCGAVLAGMGADAWGAERERRRWLLFVVLPPALLAAAAASAANVAWGQASPLGDVLAPAARALAWSALLAGLCALLAVGSGPNPGPWRGSLAIGALAVLELLVVHRDLNPTAPHALYTLRPPVLAAIDHADHGRLYVVDYLGDRGLSRRDLGRDVPYVVASRAEGPPEPWLGALGLRLYPASPVAAAWGLDESFSRDLLGIQPRPLALLYATVVRAEGTPRLLRLLQMGAVSEVVALHERGLEDLAPKATLPGPFFEPIRVFSVPQPLPRAYAVGGTRVASDDVHALQAIAGPDLDLSREVLLAEGSARAAPATFSGRVNLGPPAADRVTLVVETNAPGFVVLVDAYDPGWKATVDGQEAPVLRANLAFRAVPVPDGRHVVTMVYRPTVVVVGLAASGAAALLGVAAALWRRPRVC